MSARQDGAGLEPWAHGSPPHFLETDVNRFADKSVLVTGGASGNEPALTVARAGAPAAGAAAAIH
jgi:hypothetical protein